VTNSGYLIIIVHAIGAGNAAAFPSKRFMAKLVRFGQIWLDLSKIKAKFEQN